MDKSLKNFKNNLLIIFICYVLVVIFNLHLFTMGHIIPFMYGIILLVLGGLVLYSFLLVEKDISKSSKIAVIIGPIISLITFVGDLIYQVDLIQNFRVTGWFFIIGGILIYKTAKKVLNGSL